MRWGARRGSLRTSSRRSWPPGRRSSRRREYALSSAGEDRTMPSRGAWIEQFPGNLTWSNAALVTKGMAPYGAVALGEIDEVCERLKARQGEADAWQEEWCAMARRLERAADAAASEGRQLTAGNTYLRAGMDYFTGERFVVPGAEKRETGRKPLQCHHGGVLPRHPNIGGVQVPSEMTTRA